MPKKPQRIPFKTIRRDMFGTQRQLAQEHGGFVRYQVGRRVFTLAARAEYNQHIFITHAANYGRAFQHENLGLTIGNGLICSDGETWRRQRKLTQPAFDKELYRRVVEVTTELAQDVIQNWEKARVSGSPVDVYADMQQLALRVIGMALFSRDLQQIPNRFPEIARLVLEFTLLRNFSPIPLPLWLPIPLHRRYRQFKAETDRFIYTLIDQRLQDQTPHPDILGKLLLAYGDQAQAMRQEIRDQIVTLFFAGFETTGAALCWTWYLLSQNPASESLFHQELAAVLNGKKPTYADLDRLEYTHQIIQETLRLYPPVYTIPRRTAAADHLGEHPLEKGENLVIPIHLLHTDPAYWEEPQRFQPERFAAGRLSEDQKKAYCPFATGQRKCIGANFAILEMLTAFATLGQKFRLRLVADHPVIPQPAITLAPKYGLKMNVEQRLHA